MAVYSIATSVLYVTIIIGIYFTTQTEILCKLFAVKIKIKIFINNACTACTVGR